MKQLLILLFVFFAATANATNYYVSAAGSDANEGTSPVTAWKSIAKVNSFTYAANDSIFFNRGDVFSGTVIVNRNNLNFSAYGTGARPLISGFTTIRSWTSIGGGVYESSVAAKSNLNMVSINGRPQQIGRYPNASDANGGYLTYQNATSYSITDNTLSASVDWTGAEVVIRKNLWTLEKEIITSQSATGTIGYRLRKSYNSGTLPILSNASAGYGYFFTNDRRTLDQFGEWYFDTAAKKILVYFGAAAPTDYSVRVSTIDTLLDMGNKTFISAANLSFEGANMSAVYSMNGGNISVKNCDITNCGGKAVQIWNSGDILIDGVNTTNILCNAIEVSDGYKPNVTVRNCVVKNSGQFPGMGSWYEGNDYRGIAVIASSNSLIEYNTVDSSGIAGIQFNGNDVVVQYNIVSNFCHVLDDCGGIYTWVAGTDASPGKYYTNRIVRNNIVYNGIGAPQGTTSSSPVIGGIFLDGRSMNVSILDNTVFNVAKNGIHCNNPYNVTIRGNTLYNNKRDISFMRWAYGSITNLNIKKNISFPTTAAQNNLYYTNAGLNTPVVNTLQDNVRALGVIDSNYYNAPSDAGISMEIYSTEGGAAIPTSPYSLDGWRAFANYDLNSKKPAQKIQPYTLTNTIGSNLFVNTQFASNINNITLFSSNATAAWDNTSKITGVGSLRLNFTVAQSGRFCQLHSPIGAVSSSKKYIIRVTTYGTSANGIVKAYLRKTVSPFNDIIAQQSQSFGIGKMTHEFLLVGPTTETAASFVIAVEEGSGITYLDDIEFYEANATVNTVSSQVRFEYNATNVVKNITLDAKYIGVDSTIYNGTLTLQPYSSKIMVKAGLIDSTPIVNAGLDKLVTLPIDSVIISGTGRGGTIISYTWTKIAGPAQVTITNASKANTALSNLVAGTYSFQLRATNSAGLSGTDTLSVIVNPGILPVTLLDFSGRNNAGKVQLQWRTTSEVNSSHYTVQRSADGRRFESIGRIESNNNSNLQNNYSLLDNSPVRGINYYRLAMTDRDNSVTYSRTISVNLLDIKSFSIDNISLSSSAAAVKINVNSNQQQLINFRVVDAAGRIVTAQKLQIQNGANTLTADIPAINKGVYYVNVFTDTDAVTKTVLSE